MEFRDGVSLRRQLEDALRVAIRSGRLPPGSVLPPSRDLAEQLSVSRGVVMDSYAQLATEGYLSARRGSGTRAAALLADAAAAGAEISRPARETFYGGYAGCFRDPDGHVWEIAWNPGFTLGPDGSLVLPDFG